MDDQLRRGAETRGDHVAATMADGSIRTTYAELHRIADLRAAFLQQLGLSCGDTVALLMENSVEVLGWWWAARRAGL